MNPVKLAFPPTLAGRALLILTGAVAVLAVVWIFQSLGYRPCELCEKERYAFYAAAPLAGLAASLAAAGKSAAARALVALIALMFAANAAFASYHVGVEQGWWPGPTACTGNLSGPVKVDDLATALNAEPVVSCGDVRLRILGLSLAAWDAIVCVAIAAYAAIATRLEH